MDDDRNIMKYAIWGLNAASRKAQFFWLYIQFNIVTWSLILVARLAASEESASENAFIHTLYYPTTHTYIILGMAGAVGSIIMYATLRHTRTYDKKGGE